MKIKNLYYLFFAIAWVILGGVHAQTNWSKRLLLMNQANSIMDESETQFQSINAEYEGISLQEIWVASNNGQLNDNSNSDIVSISDFESPYEKIQVARVGFLSTTNSIEATDSTLCAGQSITFTENTAGAVSISWSFPGGSPATSTSLNPVVAYANPGQYDVIVTVAFGLGTYTDTFFNFITVNPTPSITNTFANQTVCNGANTTAIALSGPVTGTSFSWGGISSIGLSSGSSTTSFPAFTTTNATNAPSTGSVTITPTANGCVGPTKSFSVTVNPTPSITTTFANPTVCNGANTTAIALSGPVAGTSYAWGAVSSIGLSSGSNSPIFPSFTATNNTNVPSTGSVTITPTANGCVGPTKSFSVTVNPTPSISNTFSPQMVCNGANTSAIALAGPVAGTSFSWGGISSIGFPSGSGTSFPGFTATNATNAPSTGSVTIIPTANNCSGTPKSFSITVNPTPVVNPQSDQSVCAKSPIQDIRFQGPVASTSFSWTRTAGIIGLGTTGSGDIVDFRPVNTGSTPITTTITVTPSAASCVGAPVSFDLTVNPLPPKAVLDIPSLICARQVGVPLSTATPASRYEWKILSGNASVGSLGQNRALLQTGPFSSQPISLRVITVNDFECKDTVEASISVSNTPLDTATVTLLPISNTFQCLDELPGVSYQWGYDSLASLEEVILVGEISRDYAAGSTLDTLNRNYWVRTSYPGESCTVKSYHKRRDISSSTAIQPQPEPYSLKVFPNPASEQVTVAWESAQSGMITVEVFDLNGKKIYALEWFAIQGEYVLSIETGLWSRGTYYVKLKSPSNEFRSARILLL